MCDETAEGFGARDAVGSGEGFKQFGVSIIYVEHDAFGFG